MLFLESIVHFDSYNVSCHYRRGGGSTISFEWVVLYFVIFMTCFVAVPSAFPIPVGVKMLVSLSLMNSSLNPAFSNQLLAL
jgi:hypothetical protein